MNGLETVAEASTQAPRSARFSVLLIDNYDSFVFNLARYLEELDCEPVVVRNDAITLAEIDALSPKAIILSPGPKTPREAGLCESAIREFGPRIPLLGVCLGHQAIATALGGTLRRDAVPQHGRSSLIDHDSTGLFANCPQPLRVGRYHSLIVDEDTLPAELRITSRTADGVVMSMAHRTWPAWGVQFHPESLLTECGHRMLANFLKLAGIEVESTPAGDLPPEEASEALDFYRREIEAIRPL